MTSRSSNGGRLATLLIAMLASGVSLAQEAGLQISLIRQEDGAPVAADRENDAVTDVQGQIQPDL